jgi:alpha-glucosidase
MTWWKTGIVYQIYPRSFMDSNGDGVGDLRGICDKLDYLSWLGVDAIWLSPIFPSPMADFGYDVADYTGIYPLFGTLEDFDHLLYEAHRRSLRVILDFVPNHTSHQHPWFLEARSSRENPRRDWYIWSDGLPDPTSANGRRPPNNWLSYFGGPAWTWDEDTQQYYLHLFLPEQPDLNWHNPAVRSALYDAMRFWLKRGVDGFRIDTVDRMLKDGELRDNPPDPDWKPGDNPTSRYMRVYSENRPGIHELIAEFRAVFDEFEDRVSIGEIAYSPNPRDIVGFYGTDERPELNLPFNFALQLLHWDSVTIRRFVDTYEAILPLDGWPNYVLGNHDQIRLFTRFGDAQGRIAAMLLLTLRGTPFIYQGEELGLHDGEVKPEEFQDPQGINIGISRDYGRTPFHWTAGEYAGFSTVKPWLPIASDYQTLNVEAERNDPASTLSFYRRLIDLRRVHAALTLGRYQPLAAIDGAYAYLREHEGKAFLIALNFTDEPKELALLEVESSTRGLSRVSTYMDDAGQDKAVDLTIPLRLRPNEGLVIELTSIH